MPQNVSLTVYGTKAYPAYSWSPFVTKLETRLRLGGLAYERAVGIPKSGPRGKIPYAVLVQEGGDGDGDGDGIGTAPETLSDSTFIVRRLVADGHLPDLAADLGPAARAHDRAIRALLEDHLVFLQTRERWIDHYYAMRDGALGDAVPWRPLRAVVGYLAVRGVAATLQSQGALRYPAAEAQALKGEAWASVAALLEEARAGRAVDDVGQDGAQDDEPFWILGGAQPTDADATVFAFIATCLVCTAGPVSRKIVDSFPVLEDYAQRIHDRYFSEFEHWS